MIGRGVRLHAGKKDCHIIDMVGSITSGIVTTPSLFGLDPDILVEEQTGNELAQLASTNETTETVAEVSQAVQGPAIKGVEMTDYDNIHDLILNTRIPSAVNQMSPNAWVKVWGMRYVLDCPNAGNIRLDSTDGENFTAVFTSKIPAYMEIYANSPFARPRAIYEGAVPLAEAVRMADTFVKDRFSRNLVIRNAPWRKAPATANQIALVDKMLGKGWQGKRGVEEVTKGQITDIIVKLRHGIKGAAKKVISSKAKAKKEEAKLAMLKAREEVRVGPLPA